MVLSISYQYRCGADTVLVSYMWRYLVGENTNGIIPHLNPRYSYYINNL